MKDNKRKRGRRLKVRGELVRRRRSRHRRQMGRPKEYLWRKS